MRVMHVGGAGRPRVCEIGHKRGHWGHMYGDAELQCMSCGARMHGEAHGTMESGVMKMGEELDRN